MTAPRLLLAVLVLAALAGGLWYALGELETQPSAGPGLPQLSEDSLIHLEPAKLQRLTLDQPRFNHSVRLERDASGHWLLLDPVRDWAEPVAVFSALQTLYSQDWSEAPAEWTAQDLAALGLAPAELAAEVRDASGATQLLRVGATDFSGRWRAAELDGKLIRVGEGLISPLTRDSESWRDHRLQPLPPPTVTQVRWTSEQGEVLSLTRRDRGWMVLEPFQAPMDERQAPLIERMLGARAESLHLDRVADASELGDRYGLLELSGGGASYRLELRAGGIVAAHRDYAMNWSGEDFAPLFRDPELLRSPRLLALDRGNIVTLRVERGSDDGVFRRVAGGWSLDGFGALPAEESGFLEALLDYGSGLEGTSWQAVPQAPPAGRVRYSISRTPRADSPALIWWTAADGSHLVATEGAARATPTEINFDRAVTELFTRLAALR